MNIEPKTRGLHSMSRGRSCTATPKPSRPVTRSAARLHAQYVGVNRPTSAILGVYDLARPEQVIDVGAVRLDVGPAVRPMRAAFPGGG